MFIILLSGWDLNARFDIYFVLLSLSLSLSLSQVLGRFNRARAARLTLPHFVCQTPLFMPVGTQG